MQGLKSYNVMALEWPLTLVNGIFVFLIILFIFGWKERGE